MTNKKDREKNNLFMDNPFFLSISIFLGALLINYLLELDFIKNLFNWISYYFNYTLYWLNSVLQPTFKDHPYIHIPVFSNPLTPQIMAVIIPWMWLRGFLISSFAVAQIVTLIQIRAIKSKNITFTIILLMLLQFGYYASTGETKFSVPVFIELIKTYYPHLFFMMFACLAGIMAGGEYAVYLYRNNKIKVDSNKKGPNIEVKRVTEWE